MSPDTSNPFGDDPAQPSTQPNAPASDAPTAPAEANPFGAPAGAEPDNPFELVINRTQQLLLCSTNELRKPILFGSALFV